MKTNFPFNQYSTTAALYDLDTRQKTKDDVVFYTSYCGNPPGSVLELCCGTGRVAIPLATQGLEVTGLDISPAMLEVFGEKLSAQPEAVQERIKIVQADMTAFDLGQKFRYIIIPFSSFQGLTADEDITACLDCIHRHLTDDGAFIVHTFRPLMQLNADNWVTTEETTTIEQRDENNVRRFKRTGLNKTINTDTQIMFSDSIFYTYDENGNETQRLVEHLRLKYYYQEQLEKLVTDNGFAVKEVFGYYDRSPVTDASTEMILVCGKAYSAI
ncbi:MAG: class I SAM-dependent methyltransferase [Bacteroidetes bacterium]|nr:class I SAM-dependent methyltransferase [Bacteroidota bacterium]